MPCDAARRSARLSLQGRVPGPCPLAPAQRGPPVPPVRAAQATARTSSVCAPGLGSRGLSARAPGSARPRPFLRARRCGGSARRARFAAGVAAPRRPPRPRQVPPWAVAGAAGVPSLRRARPVGWSVRLPLRRSVVRSLAVARRLRRSAGSLFGRPCRLRRRAAALLPGAVGRRCPPAPLVPRSAPPRGAAGAGLRARALGRLRRPRGFWGSASAPQRTTFRLLVKVRSSFPLDKLHGTWYHDHARLVPAAFALSYPRNAKKSQ